MVQGGELWWSIRFLDYFGVQLCIYSEHCCLWDLVCFFLMLSNLRLLPPGWLVAVLPQWHPSSLGAPVLAAGAEQHTASEHLGSLIIWYKGPAKPFCREAVSVPTESYGGSSPLWDGERSLLASRIGSRIMLAVGWTCGNVILTCRIARSLLLCFRYLKLVFSEPLCSTVSSSRSWREQWSAMSGGN